MYSYTGRAQKIQSKMKNYLNKRSIISYNDILFIKYKPVLLFSHTNNAELLHALSDMQNTPKVN